MANAGTATGINTGELSEYVLALRILASVTDLPVDFVNAKVSAAAGGVWKGPRVARVAGVEFGFDGKTAVAVTELDLHRRTPNPIVTALSETARSVVPQLELPERVVRVENFGASKKCDVRVVGRQRSLALSLKFAHDYPARFQTPKWAGVLRTFAVCGLDVSAMEGRYRSRYDRFIAGGRRNSKAKGDYGPGLVAATQELLEAFDELNRFVVAHAPAIFDASSAAAGLVGLYVGDEDTVAFIDMSDGAIHHVTAGHGAVLARDLHGAPVVARRRRSESGRTLDLDLHVAGEALVTLRTTVSTNPARHDREWRIPKPQTYVGPNLARITAATSARSQRRACGPSKPQQLCHPIRTDDAHPTL